MIHINSGMKYTTCSVSHPLIQNRYLSTFSLSSVKSVRSAKTKQKSASNATALYMLWNVLSYVNTSQKFHMVTGKRIENYLTMKNAADV